MPDSVPRLYQLVPCGCATPGECRCAPVEDQPYFEVVLRPVPSPTVEQIRRARELTHCSGNYLAIRKLLRAGGVGIREQLVEQHQLAAIEARLAGAGLPVISSPSVIWRKILPRRGDG
jgi:hypothetical protein